MLKSRGLAFLRKFKGESLLAPFLLLSFLFISTLSSTAIARDLNPGISGRLLIVNNQYASYLMDISSGKYEKIPGSDWRKREFGKRGTARFWVDASGFNLKEFVVRTKNCRKANSDPLSPDITCISIIGLDGSEKSRFDVLYDVTGPAKLSRDGEYIAFFRRQGISVNSSYKLEVYSRSGKLVNGSNFKKSTFSWLPDGRIVFLKGRGIVFTKPYSAKPSHQLMLPKGVPGAPAGVSVSPDGKRIAFAAVSSSNFATTYSLPFVMNIDGTNIRKLATVPKGSTPAIGSPIWSPDGKWILLPAGGASGQDLSARGVMGYMFAVPANLKKTAVLSIVDSERSAEVRRMRRYNDFEHDSDRDSVSERFPSWDMFGIP